MMEEIVSNNPATGEVIWRGKSAEAKEIDEAIEKASHAFNSWKLLPLEKRIGYLHAFADSLKSDLDKLAEIISLDSGKPLWESRQEVSLMMQKVAISIDAERERCPGHETKAAHSTFSLHHKPHGVIAVFGPFNFPGHLPNGHIVPALLAGNTVVLKSSELTPLVSEAVAHHWTKILPPGVFHLLQGGPETGRLLARQPGIKGLFFTGSYRTGAALLEQLGKDCEKILALEMGGNNPLVVHDIRDVRAAAYLIIQSAFLTAGQRCSATRRLIVIQSKENEELVQTLVSMMQSIKIGPFTDHPEPFMGPVISNQSCDRLLQAQENLEKMGGKSIVKMKRLFKNAPFLNPGIMDVTDVSSPPDEEYFGPFLQLYWVGHFDEAIAKAKQTQYGLTAAIFTQDQEKYQKFFNEIDAGIINWNQATTGASSRLPFGGVKKSGNHRPSAYYAADYCAYPVAGSRSPTVTLPKEIYPGIAIS